MLRESPGKGGLSWTAREGPPVLPHHSSYEDLRPLPRVPLGGGYNVSRFRVILFGLARTSGRKKVKVEAKK